MKPYQQGWDAGYNNTDASQPYPEGTRAWRDWRVGRTEGEEMKKLLTRIASRT